MSLETYIEYLDTKVSPHDSDKQLAFELHDLLTERADWTAEHWDFDQTGIIAFASKIRKLYDNSPHGISFQAIFAPDLVESVREVSIEQLEDILRSNKVGTRTRYVAKK